MLLRIPEAAERLGLRPATIRAWLWRRKIGHVRVGARAVRIRSEDIENLIEAGYVPPRSGKTNPQPVEPRGRRGR